MSNEQRFRAIGLLADRNGDVRLSNTVTECRMVKAGSILSFGIDTQTGRDIRKQMVCDKNTHIIVCMIISADELDKTEYELKNKKTGIDIIAEERARQLAIEGWTPEHDDQHEGQQLACAAAAYAWPAEFDGFETIDNPEFPGETMPSGADRKDMFPFEQSWWKPSPDDRIKELAKSGALIAAEIERLQRKGTPTQDNTKQIK